LSGFVNLLCCGKERGMMAMKPAGEESAAKKAGRRTRAAGNRRPAPGRTRVNDPDAMRRRVLDAAAEAFQARGYHATSVHDIMQTAGVSGGALHHHFASKKALGLAVIRERVAPVVEETWIAPVRSARSAANGILRVFDEIAQGLDARKRVLGCPLGNLAAELSLADIDFRKEMQHVYDRWRDAIAQRLRADRGAGALPALDPETFATFVVASYSGAIALAKAQQAAGPLRACARQLAAVMRMPQRLSAARA
jgi:AcrR family transcriptional regulator